MTSGCEYSDEYEIDMEDDARMKTDAKRIAEVQRRKLKQRQKGILEERRKPMQL